MEQETNIWTGRPSQVSNLGTYFVCALLCVTGFGAIFAFPYAIWKYLVIRNYKYELTSQRLRRHRGVLNKETDELELYRVKDTRSDQPFMLRLFGLGNVQLISPDATTPVASIHAVKNAEVPRTPAAVREHYPDETPRALKEVGYGLIENQKLPRKANPAHSKRRREL